MIVVNGKMNWRQALIEFLEPKGFFVQKNNHLYIVFMYRSSKIKFKQKHGNIICDPTRYGKIDDGVLTFYEDLYIQECDNKEARKTNKKRLESALATKVMMFELALKHEISEALPEVENIKTDITNRNFQIIIQFKDFNIEFFRDILSLDTLIELDLFQVKVRKDVYHITRTQRISYNNTWTTLQEFTDKIHTEDFQVAMDEFRKAIDENRKKTLQDEIKDLEKSIQWRKSELDKMLTDEKNLIYKIF